MSRRRIVIVCRNCGKSIHPHYSSFGIYCCLTCQIEYQTKLKIDNWLSGKINPYNTNGLLRPWARRYVFKINSNKCSQCGWAETNKYTGRIPLEIDHIDGNFKNNSLENIRLLCPNCHSLTSTFKNSNKGHGRKRGKIK
jgi:Zn finger protein HypA/HybF involved in hydrogenase expression